jgi:hypothetical protein
MVCAALGQRASSDSLNAHSRETEYKVPEPGTDPLHEGP